MKTNEKLKDIVRQKYSEIASYGIAFCCEPGYCN